MRKIIISLLIALITITAAFAGIKKGNSQNIQKDFQYSQTVNKNIAAVLNFHVIDGSGHTIDLAGNSIWRNPGGGYMSKNGYLFIDLDNNSTYEYIPLGIPRYGSKVGWGIYRNFVLSEGRIKRIFSNLAGLQNKEGDVNINYNINIAGHWVIDYLSPIVLDLNNDKKIDVAYNYWLPHAPKFFDQNVVLFDISGDRVPDLVEWVVGTNDGLLVEPGVDKVTSALDLFGTAGGYKDGFEKLSKYDKDNNGFIEGKELEGFKVWIDKNQNGKCEENELFDIKQFNIKRLSVNHNGKYVSYYETNDGQKRLMWDWWPAAIEVKKIAKE
jgi:hypothetical protein